MTIKYKTVKPRITSNRLLFILGLLGTAASVPLKNSILWVFGLMMALTGLFNLGTWPAEPFPGKLTAAERRTRLIALMLYTALLVFAGWLYIWIGSLA